MAVTSAAAGSARSSRAAKPAPWASRTTAAAVSPAGAEVGVAAGPLPPRRPGPGGHRGSDTVSVIAVYWDTDVPRRGTTLFLSP